MLTLAKYSIGVGDRFAHQAKAQLRACMQAGKLGAEVIPVWNKSYREHSTVGSEPGSVRAAADAAVRELGWKKPYHVDADHIRLETVDGFHRLLRFLHHRCGRLDRPTGRSGCAEGIRRPASRTDRPASKSPGSTSPFTTVASDVERIAGKVSARGSGCRARSIGTSPQPRARASSSPKCRWTRPIAPQTPPELLVILAAIADEKIPIQTIAPKFTGRFNKGVDYVGDVVQFEKEFQQDLAVIAFADPAIWAAGQPEAERPFRQRQVLHLRPDSPSDCKIRTPGLHVKTAGTTWLEEVIGLAEAGRRRTRPGQRDLRQGAGKARALCAPVRRRDRHRSRASSHHADTVKGWSAEQFVSALRHDPRCPGFNAHLRQLIHVGYKIAAQMGDRYLKMLEACEPNITKNVTENLLDRHLKPLFIAES